MRKKQKREEEAMRQENEKLEKEKKRHQEAKARRQEYEKDEEEKKRHQEEEVMMQQEQSMRAPTPTFATLKSTAPKKLPKIPKLTNPTFLLAEQKRDEGEACCTEMPLLHNAPDQSSARPRVSLPSTGIWEGLAEKKDEIRVYK